MRTDPQHSPRPAPVCTGLGASWCPIHGDCICDRDDRTLGLDNPRCPLHGTESTHANPRRHLVEGVREVAEPERISFRVYASEGTRFAESAADRMVGSETKLGETPCRVLAARIVDDGQGMELTVENTTGRLIMLPPANEKGFSMVLPS